MRALDALSSLRNNGRSVLYYGPNDMAKLGNRPVYGDLSSGALVGGDKTNVDGLRLAFEECVRSMVEN